jgi:16S rRNA (uracil1498-N3)-methyltransferase
VVPVLCERTAIRPPAGGWADRVARWQRIAAEATKQCGRARVPEVDAPCALQAWIVRESAGAGLLVCLWEESPSAFADPLPPPPVPRATLVVGPEGGLAAAEVDALRAAGAVVTGVGPRILRTETAGPVGLALLQTRYGDLASRADA